MSSPPSTPPAAKRLKLDSGAVGVQSPLSQNASPHKANGHANEGESSAAPPPPATSAPPLPPVASASTSTLAAQPAITLNNIAEDGDDDSDDEAEEVKEEEEDVSRRDMYLDTVRPSTQPPFIQVC